MVCMGCSNHIKNMSYLKGERMNIEIIDSKCKVVDDSLLPVIATFISYRENGAVKYLVSICLIDDELKFGNYIVDDDVLFNTFSEDSEKLSDSGLARIDEIKDLVRKPESAEEMKLVEMSKELIKEKAKEQGWLDEEEGEEFL